MYGIKRDLITFFSLRDNPSFYFHLCNGICFLADLFCHFHHDVASVISAASFTFIYLFIYFALVYFWAYLLSFVSLFVDFCMQILQYLCY